MFERYDAELSKNGVETFNVYHRHDEKNSGIRSLRKKNWSDFLFSPRFKSLVI